MYVWMSAWCHLTVWWFISWFLLSFTLIFTVQLSSVHVIFRWRPAVTVKTCEAGGWMWMVSDKTLFSRTLFLTVNVVTVVFKHQLQSSSKPNQALFLFCPVQNHLLSSTNPRSQCCVVEKLWCHPARRCFDHSWTLLWDVEAIFLLISLRSSWPNTQRQDLYNHVSECYKLPFWVLLCSSHWLVPIVFHFSTGTVPFLAVGASFHVGWIWIFVPRSLNLHFSLILVFMLKARLKHQTLEETESKRI